MKSGRFAALCALFALLFSTVPPAAAQPPVKQPADEPPNADAGRPGGSVDLATVQASRWIVQLSEPPLTGYTGGLPGLKATSNTATGAERLDAEAGDSQAYVSHLNAAHGKFQSALSQAVPRAQVEQRYTTVLNGMAVRMSSSEAAAVRHLPGVRAVTPDVPYHLDMFSTPAQIGAPEMWAKLGGQAHAGEGVKVAIVDSGIYVTRDASGKYAGNPCFDDAGYPQPPRGFPKGDTRFTNKKVLVARAYFRPDDPPTAGDETAIQGPNGSPHGTHTAGTVACDANTQVTFQGATVAISGVAPRAYLMNYRVFYPSQTTDAFTNGNAFVSELVHAIDDAVHDGADVISNSWGASYQNTLAWPDPMVQAAEGAVDAGVVMVFANGNDGPSEDTVGSPAVSSKVISVGAVTKNATITPGRIDVTAPAPVPASLTNLAVGPAQFGPPPVTTHFGPANFLPVERVSTNTSALGCSLANDASPYPAGALAGKIALVSRGVCTFSEKVFNAQRGGAVAALVYNSAANGDNLQAMGPGAHATEVSIPSWFMRRSDGLALRDFANAHPADAAAQFTYAPHVAANIGDVMASFSSRGPTQDKFLKPDVVAPGVDVLSSGYGTGAFPAQFTGFGAASGTSMATPHVAGAAALLKQLHPRWRPWEIKSALMTTASENVFLDTAHAQPAAVVDRGAGRIDLTRAGSPGVVVDHPSLSAGELAAGQSRRFVLTVRDVSGARSTWTASATVSGGSGANAPVVVTFDPPTLSIDAQHAQRFTIRVAVSATAPATSYEGDVLLTNSAGGAQIHMPLWLRVVPTTHVADVLLVDDDGSGFDPTLHDYAATYQATLTGLGVTFTYVDIDQVAFPSLNTLFGYRAVVIFTGENNSFNNSGFAVSDLDTLMEWLDSGGRVWVTGQNIADVYTTPGNAPNSDRLGRGRFYNGYLGLAFSTGSLYPGAPPRPTANGVGAAAGLKLDLSPGGDGAGNQQSIDVSVPIPDTDTFAATSTTQPFFHPLAATTEAGGAISFTRGSEPSLEESRLKFHYRGLSMDFGLEGVNSNTGFSTRQAVARRSLDWLFDEVSVKLKPAQSGDEERGAGDRPTGNRTTGFSAVPSSSVGATFTKFRWDFGDGSPIVTTTVPTVQHRFNHRNGNNEDGTFTVRVEATDTLGHQALATTRLRGGSD